MQTINIQKLNLSDNAKVLDLGSGQGRHCYGAYKLANLDVYAFDLIPKAPAIICLLYTSPSPRD